MYIYSIFLGPSPYMLHKWYNSPCWTSSKESWSLAFEPMWLVFVHVLSELPRFCLHRCALQHSTPVPGIWAAAWALYNKCWSEMPFTKTGSAYGLPHSGFLCHLPHSLSWNDLQPSVSFTVSKRMSSEPMLSYLEILFFVPCHCYFLSLLHWFPLNKYLPWKHFLESSLKPR